MTGFLNFLSNFAFCFPLFLLFIYSGKAVFNYQGIGLSHKRMLAVFGNCQRTAELFRKGADGFFGLKIVLSAVEYGGRDVPLRYRMGDYILIVVPAQSIKGEGISFLLSSSDSVTPDQSIIFLTSRSISTIGDWNSAFSNGIAL